MSMAEHPMRLWLVLSGLLIAAVLLLPAPANAQPTCGQTITADTKLQSDVICYSSETNPDPDGLVIGASGITLNLNGHTVGAYHYAIRNDGYDDVVIKNGTVGGDYEGVHLVDAERNTLRNLQMPGVLFAVRGTNVDGLSLIGSRTGYVTSLTGDDIVVRDNTFSGGMGTLFVGGDGNRVLRNTSTGVEGGISVFGNHNRIAWNTSTPWFDAGISMAHGNGNVVEHNAITGRPEQGWCGMSLEDVRGTLVRDNTITYEQTGIWLKSGDGNVLLRNHVTNAPPNGNCFTSNGTDPPNDGLHVDAAATSTVLWGNFASNMRDDGIDADGASTHLRRNRATNNGDLGIEAVPGAADLGGNTASGNGNPLQCTNVFCR
jgi:parallel beta-helix repeat protein